MSHGSSEGLVGLRLVGGPVVGDLFGSSLGVDVVGPSVSASVLVVLESGSRTRSVAAVARGVGSVRA